MLDIAGIFENRTPVPSRLLEFGFIKIGNDYTISYEILDAKFQMNIILNNTDVISVKVIDNDNQEEYVLIHLPGTRGPFIGSIIQACEEKLEMIANKCFEYNIFMSEQTRQIIEYVEKVYQNKLEFLWEKSPKNGIFRCNDGGKWYAAILTVAKEKIGLEGKGMVEIIDLRALPNEIIELVDDKKYFKGYHMNKKHWYTICLNDSVSTQEICQRIKVSYSLTKKS